jgi:hypothetical protein
MNQTIGALRVLSSLCWALFVWAIAAELDFLPALGDDFIWRWQFALFGGIVCWVTAERLADLRCRCCGAAPVLLRGLLTASHELLCHRCLKWNPAPERSLSPETRSEFQV